MAAACGIRLFVRRQSSRYWLLTNRCLPWHLQNTLPQLNEQLLKRNQSEKIVQSREYTKNHTWEIIMQLQPAQNTYLNRQYPLHEAVDQLDSEAITTILQFSPTFFIKQKDNEGKTPLHRLFSFCPEKKYQTDINEIAKKLLAVKPIIDEKDIYGNTALYCACENDSWLGAELLCQYGANPHAENFAGKTPRGLVARPQVDNPTKYKMLGQYRLYFPLLKSIKGNNYQAIVNCLQSLADDERKEILTLKDDDDATLLHHAIQKFPMAFVPLLQAIPLPDRISMLCQTCSRNSPSDLNPDEHYRIQDNFTPYAYAMHYIAANQVTPISNGIFSTGNRWLIQDDALVWTII